MKLHGMKVLGLTAATLCLGSLVMAEERGRKVNAKSYGLGNELIDATAFNKAALVALQQREGRRITESQFIEMSKDENTIVLDTRSAANFALLHVKGAVHLNFSEITTRNLAQKIPNKDTRILIYCNNNFDKEPKKGPPAFESKSPGMALNIPTYITLHAYGYKNVYELGPLLEVSKTRIPLFGQKLVQAQAPRKISKL